MLWVVISALPRYKKNINTLGVRKSSLSGAMSVAGNLKCDSLWFLSGYGKCPKISNTLFHIFLV